MSGGACYQFQQTGSCKFGDSCRFSHGGMGGADMNGYAGGGGWGRPDNGFGRPPFAQGFGGGFGGAPRGFGSSGPCYSFQETGQCRFGETCRYSHGDAQAGGGSFGGSWGSSFARRPAASQICYTFRDSGSCKFGDSCRYSHAPDGAMMGGDPYGAPRRFGGGGGNSGVCYNFQQTGSCKFGDTCRFSHSLDKKDEQVEQGPSGMGEAGQPHMEQN